MTTYNTGNPIGSTDPRDLYDNAENFDNAVNDSTATTWTDRLGVARKTVFGAFQDITYKTPEAYAVGLSFLTTDANKTVEESGVVYAPLNSALPFTTSGTFSGDDDARFYPVQDKNNVIRVTSIAAMEAYSAPVGYVFSLNAGGRSGVFDVIAGDFSTELAADTLNGIYVGLTNNPTATTKVAKRRIEDNFVTPEMFGAVADGSADDRESIQAAVDFVLSQDGGHVLFNAATYRIASTHPTRTTAALVIEPYASGQFSRGNIKLSGIENKSIIILDVDTTYLLYVPVRTNYLNLTDLVLNANLKADYAFHAQDEYNPYMSLTNCRFQFGKVDCAKIATFVATFTKCIFERSNGVGLKIQAPAAGPNTSIVLNACYANNNATAGYDFGFLTYCSLNGCAADNNDICYLFRSAYGVSMSGCGAESSRRPIVIEGYRGFVISTFFMLSCGDESAGSPVEYLVEFQSGTDATVSGIRHQGGRFFTYLLGSTGDSFGSENITVLDRSVGRANSNWVSNFAFDRPIKFLRGDSSNKDSTLSVTTAAELRAAVQEKVAYEVLHSFVIQCADGTYDLASSSAYVEKVSGNGEFVIAGNALDNTAVVLQTDFRRIQVLDCSAKIVLRDLTISGSVIIVHLIGLLPNVLQALF